MTTQRPVLTAGSLFGPYRLDRLIGRGGMGEVFEAYDTVKDRTVAIKVLPEKLNHDPVFRERFRRESHAAARLKEPHIIPIHDYGEIEGRLYIDMRLVDGANLRSVLKAEAPLAPDRAVAVIRQVAAALDAAHADDLVHRDIKPDNILLTTDGFVYLVDFGIAQSSTSESLTSDGSAVGSFHYMAPERFTSRLVTPAADVYALACVLYECLTGARPYPATTDGEVMRAHLVEPPPRPSMARHEVPQAFDAVIARGLAKNLNDRYPTAGELAAAAESALTDGDVDPAARGPREVLPDNEIPTQADTGQLWTPTQVTLPSRPVVTGQSEVGDVPGETRELAKGEWRAETGPPASTQQSAAAGEVVETSQSLPAAQRLVADEPATDSQSPTVDATDRPPAADPGSARVPTPSRTHRRILQLVALTTIVILCATIAFTTWALTDTTAGTAVANSSAPRGPDIELLSIVGASGYKRFNCAHRDPDATTVAVVFCDPNPAASDPAARFLRFRTLDHLRAYYRGLFFDVFRSTNCPGDPPGQDGPSVVDGKEVGRKACFASRADDPAVPKPGLVLTNESALAVGIFLWATPDEQRLRDYIAFRNAFQFKSVDAAQDPDHFTPADRAVLDRLQGDFGPNNCRHVDPPVGPANALLGCGTRVGFPSASFVGIPDRQQAKILYQANLGQFAGHACGGAQAPDDVWRKDSGPVGRFFCHLDNSTGPATCLMAVHDEFLLAAHFCTLRADDPDPGPKTEADLLAWFRKYFG
ncbi:serine/threonine-protein kinase [Nocardia altamirensis]|uniref:serine/threonine-protein kinase n=1 Tax=Nocardia altamirensis TaxID=472158 RepID=UPI00084081DE